MVSMFSLDFFDMYLSIILISAMSNPVKIIAKRVNVVITEDVGILDIAARAGISPSISHGCRPTSATTQPASLHIHTNGMDIMAIICRYLLPSIISRFLYAKNRTAI